MFNKIIFNMWHGWKHFLRNLVSSIYIQAAPTTSNHMDDKYKAKMKLWDNKSLELTTKEAMEVNTKQGKKNIYDTYYTLGLKHN